jgi:hypothetical protein
MFASTLVVPAPLSVFAADIPSRLPRRVELSLEVFEVQREIYDVLSFTGIGPGYTSAITTFS